MEGINVNAYRGLRHSVLALFSVWALFIGAKEIVERSLIEVEGTIVSSQTTTGDRPVTTYIIRGSDHVDRQYVAGPTDASLPRRLSVGAYLKKERYELAWQKNQNIVNDFPLGFYLGACGIGIMLGYWSFSQWRRNRRNYTPPLKII